MLYMYIIYTTIVLLTVPMMVNLLGVVEVYDDCTVCNRELGLFMCPVFLSDFSISNRKNHGSQNYY